MTAVERSLDRRNAEPAAGTRPTSTPSNPLSCLVAPDPFRRVRVTLVSMYVGAYGIWFVTQGVIIDRISEMITVVALLALAHVGLPARRWVKLAGDVILYALMWLVYQESRGIADRIGMPLQVESVRNVDRALLFGRDVSVELQHHFYDPRHVRWYDVVGSLVYMSHYWLPIAVIVTLWIRNRRQWVRFVRRFATVLFVACIMFVVVPTAPPWMAAGGDSQIRLNALEPVQRITWRGWRHVGLDGFAHAWDTGRDWLNNVAAMPSLHAGFSLFVVVFAFPWVRRGSARAALLMLPVAMATSLVYFGEHYLADAVAAWIVVGLTFLGWNRVERSLRRRRIARSRRAVAEWAP